MITTYTYASAQQLIEGCLQPHEEAWWGFYERFGELLQRAVRRALGSLAADANVVDDLVQDVRVHIFEARIGLSVFEERPELLEEFLEGCARTCVRRYLARQTRRKHHEVQAGDDQLAQLIAEAEVLDQLSSRSSGSG
jgi:DNA-directed RNA polymerase specialized sigma24 family protein